VLLRSLHRSPVAARLAGDDTLKIADAGEPDCYDD
jgi:hypothetical protein